MKRLILLLLIVIACKPENEKWLISSPAGDNYTQINRQGETIIPNGRILTPYGRQLTVAPHPFGLVLSPDGKTIITANSGTGPFSISVITDFDSENPIQRQIPDGVTPDEGLLAAVFMGLAVSPDNEKVFVSGGQENLIYVFDIKTGKKF
jgi:DNA-binding beta-propeller fold protein YncE